MKELINNILETSKERLKNPIIGAFLFSWSAFNWKSIAILLFGSGTIQQKVNVIESNHTNLTENLWLPLVITVFYLAALPYFLLMFDWLSSAGWKGRKKLLVEKQVFELKSKQQLAIEESRLEIIRAEYREKADLNTRIDLITNQLDERNKLIVDLKDELNLAITKNKNYEGILKSENKGLYTEEEKAELNRQYLLFKDSDLFQYFGDLGTELAITKSVPTFMEQLVTEKFRFKDIINEVHDEVNQRHYYEFTKKGKFFWKNYVLSMDLNNSELDDGFDSDIVG